jgi:hypothetical protein
MQNKSQELSRRTFLAQTSYFGAMYAAASVMPLRALAGTLAQDPRISAAPVVDKGYAAVRKIGNGLYATISDTSKGLQTMCNGGFLVGTEGAMAIEGFVTAAGAAFQLETLHSISQVPVKGALDTHYHFDHSMGNAVYGARGIPLWAHPTTAKRIYDSYGPWQRMDKAAVTAPVEKMMAGAKSGVLGEIQTQRYVGEGLDRQVDRITSEMTMDGYMEQIRCPTLLIAGEFDPRSPIDEVYRLFDQLKAIGFDAVEIPIFKTSDLAPYERLGKRLSSLGLKATPPVQPLVDDKT